MTDQINVRDAWETLQANARLIQKALEAGAYNPWPNVGRELKQTLEDIIKTDRMISAQDWRHPMAGRRSGPFGGPKQNVMPEIDPAGWNEPNDDS